MPQAVDITRTGIPVFPLFNSFQHPLTLYETPSRGKNKSCEMGAKANVCKYNGETKYFYSPKLPDATDLGIKKCNKPRNCALEDPQEIV
jgi:hypothetical protein